MPRQIITTPHAPDSPLYSQGVKAGPFVFVSGTTGVDPKTGGLAGPTVQNQTRQAIANCEAILQAGGASLDDVLEVGVLLSNPGDTTGMNEEYGRWFPTDPPASEIRSDAPLNCSGCGVHITPLAATAGRPGSIGGGVDEAINLPNRRFH